MISTPPSNSSPPNRKKKISLKLQNGNIYRKKIAGRKVGKQRRKMEFSILLSRERECVLQNPASFQLDLWFKADGCSTLKLFRVSIFSLSVLVCFHLESGSGRCRRHVWGGGKVPKNVFIEFSSSFRVFCEKLEMFSGEMLPFSSHLLATAFSGFVMFYLIFHRGRIRTTWQPPNI